MNFKYTKYLLLIVNIFVVSVYAQQTGVAYRGDFKLNEGIYLTFDQFRANDPISKRRLVTTWPKDEMQFMRQVVDQDKITYLDGAGTKHEIETKKLWGYSDNNTLYIYKNNSFNRVTTIGSLCHFISKVTTYVMNNNPYAPGGVGMGMSYSVPVNELVQFLLDTENGNVYECTIENLSLLLQRDPELLAEFEKLRSKKKRESLLLFVRKYNERHPLFF